MSGLAAASGSKEMLSCWEFHFEECDKAIQIWPWVFRGTKDLVTEWCSRASSSERHGDTLRTAWHERLPAHGLSSPLPFSCRVFSYFWPQSVWQRKQRWRSGLEPGFSVRDRWTRVRHETPVGEGRQWLSNSEAGSQARRREGSAEYGKYRDGGPEQRDGGTEQRDEELNKGMGDWTKGWRNWAPGSFWEELRNRTELCSWKTSVHSIGPWRTPQVRVITEEAESKRSQCWGGGGRRVCGCYTGSRLGRPRLARQRGAEGSPSLAWWLSGVKFGLGLTQLMLSSSSLVLS